MIKRGDAYGLVGVQTGQMCVGNNLMTRNELIRGLFHKTITFTHCTGEFWLLTGALQVAAMLLERSTNEWINEWVGCVYFALCWCRIHFEVGFPKLLFFPSRFFLVPASETSFAPHCDKQPHAEHQGNLLSLFLGVKTKQFQTLRKFGLQR